VREKTFVMASTDIALRYESLLEVPSSSSTVVVQTKGEMINRMNFQAMAKDFSNLAKFLRLAYNGVVGEVQIQIKVKKLFYETVRLCDESVFTINEFSRASNTAVESLLATYEFLMDGLDTMAIANVQEISQVAERMRAAAQNLAIEFSKEAAACQKLEEETTTASAAANQRSKDSLAKKKQAQIDKEKEEGLYINITEEEQKARKEYEDSREQHFKAIDQQKLGWFKGFLNAVTGS